MNKDINRKYGFYINTGWLTFDLPRGQGSILMEKQHFIAFAEFLQFVLDKNPQWGNDDHLTSDEDKEMVFYTSGFDGDYADTSISTEQYSITFSFAKKDFHDIIKFFKEKA